MGNIINRKRKPALGTTTRVIVPSHLVADGSTTHPNAKYCNNFIKTTKYRLWTFIPKNVFEQMHRLANIYFLFIVLLNFVPLVNAVNKWLALAPLIFVLSVTGIKDAFEDYRRYKSDKEVNHQWCRVYSKSLRRYVRKEWWEVQVGDILHLSCNEMVPADLVMLRSSDHQGLCHVDTSSLDGESNLKQKQIVRQIQQGAEFHPTMFTHVIECEEPNMNIYSFSGTMSSQLGEKIPVSLANVLLRGCSIRNTDFIEGIVVYAGHDTKVLLNNKGPRHKRSKLERTINRDVLLCFVILFCLCLLSSVGAGVYQAHYNHLNASIPFIQYGNSSEGHPGYLGFVRFWRFIIVYQAMIPLSMYVTVELVKLGQVFFIHSDRNLQHKPSKKGTLCRALNITEDLGQVEYVFSDKTGTLTENRMVFKQCSVDGISYRYGKQNEAADLRASEAALHRQTSQLFDTNGEASVLDVSDPVSTVTDDDCQLVDHFLSGNAVVCDFLIALAICNTVVVNDAPHEDEIDDSGNILEEPVAQPSGQIPLKQRLQQKLRQALPKARSQNQYSQWANEESPVTRAVAPPVHRLDKTGFKMCYEADSPDELALVKAAASYQCVLLSRTVDSVTVRLPDNSEIAYRLLHTLHFDPVRKRQSVIVQDTRTNDYVLYSKGADSAICNNLTPPQDKHIVDITKDHILSYAKEGLRTLCIAKRVLSVSEYRDWLTVQEDAENTLAGRDEKLLRAATKIEKNLQLLGATGIEDRLQENVPETISALKEAGIVVWVLTGDKQETAISIAFSCHLIKPQDELIILNAESLDQTRSLLQGYVMKYQTGPPSMTNPNSKFITHISTFLSLNCDLPESSAAQNFLPGFKSDGGPADGLETDGPKQLVLVVDGHTLEYIIKGHLEVEFIQLAQLCSSVVCVRATPFQKAEVVRIVKKQLNKQTLAVGDGANDVSMLQTADVGVGVSGREGMQAVMASDFAIPRFHFLQRLLLVHGHWCYDRLARMVLYLWYKNIMYVLVLLWIQCYSGFTGGYPYNDFNLIFFNLFYTSLPPLSFGIWEQHIPASMLLNNPSLYRLSQKGQIYTPFSLLFVLFSAIWESLAAFFIPYFAHNDSPWSNWEFGVTLYTGIIFTQLAHISVNIHNWTILQFLGIFLSLVNYYTFSLLINVACLHCSFPAETYRVFQMTLSTALHWLCVLIVLMVTTLPRVGIKSVLNTFWPSTTLHARSVAKAKHHNVKVTWSSNEEKACINTDTDA